MLHRGCGGGHLGVAKTFGKIQKRFFWANMKQDVSQWCKECSDCASRKSPPCTPRAPMKPVYVCNPMEKIALDILGPLPVTEAGNRYVVVISDYFTRWSEAFPLPNQEATTVAKKLTEDWICCFGAPYSIHTDQGRNFESKLFAELCELLDVWKTRTSPYHPQSDGLVERLNRTILMMLSIVLEKQSNWDKYLPYVMFAYRSSVHKTTGYTPFQLMFGREVKLPVDVMFGRPNVNFSHSSEYIKELHSVLESSFKLAREVTQRKQERQKDHYDVQSSDGRYKVGDVVWLYLPVVKKGQSPKFMKPWKGPYKIVKVLSDVNYRIKFEGSGPRKTQVVHFNRLKPYYESTVSAKEAGQSIKVPVATPDVEEEPFLIPVAPASRTTMESSNNEARTPPNCSHNGEQEQTEQMDRTSVPDRGGTHWAGRLRSSVHPPDRLQY